MKTASWLIVSTLALAACSTGGNSDIKGRLAVKSSHAADSASVATALGELYVEGDIETDANLNVAGTLTATGATTQTGDLTLQGGASALSFSDSASSVVLPDNDTTALLIGSTGQLDLLTFDTGDDTETVIVTGTTTALAFKLDTGTAEFDETVLVTGDLTCAGGAGAVTFSDSASSIVVPDADTTALLVGSTGLLNGITYDSSDNAENVLFSMGVGNAAVSITGATTLDASDCGKPLFVTAGIDTLSITLPALSAVPAGCALSFYYVGADGGALLDISPNAADGVEGGCTLAASVVTFSGTDDADIGLTKATGLTGDTITLVSGNADDWYVKACQGIWANN